MLREQKDCIASLEHVPDGVKIFNLKFFQIFGLLMLSVGLIGSQLFSSWGERPGEVKPINPS